MDRNRHHLNLWNAVPILIGMAAFFLLPAVGFAAKSGSSISAKELQNAYNQLNQAATGAACQTDSFASSWASNFNDNGHNDFSGNYSEVTAGKAISYRHIRQLLNGIRLLVGVPTNDICKTDTENANTACPKITASISAAQLPPNIQFLSPGQNTPVTSASSGATINLASAADSATSGGSISADVVKDIVADADAITCQPSCIGIISSTETACTNNVSLPLGDSNTPYTIVSSSSSCIAGASCEAYCNSGYTKSGNSCVACAAPTTSSVGGCGDTNCGGTACSQEQSCQETTTCGSMTISCVQDPNCGAPSTCSNGFVPPVCSAWQAVSADPGPSPGNSWGTFMQSYAIWAVQTPPANDTTASTAVFPNEPATFTRTVYIPSNAVSVNIACDDSCTVSINNNDHVIQLPESYSNHSGSSTFAWPAAYTGGTYTIILQDTNASGYGNTWWANPAGVAFQLVDSGGNPLNPPIDTSPSQVSNWTATVACSSGDYFDCNNCVPCGSTSCTPSSVTSCISGYNPTLNPTGCGGQTCNQGYACQLTSYSPSSGCPSPSYDCVPDSTCLTSCPNGPAQPLCPAYLVTSTPGNAAWTSFMNQYAIWIFKGPANANNPGGSSATPPSSYNNEYVNQIGTFTRTVRVSSGTYYVHLASDDTGSVAIDNMDNVVCSNPVVDTYNNCCNSGIPDPLQPGSPGEPYRDCGPITITGGTHTILLQDTNIGGYTPSWFDNGGGIGMVLYNSNNTTETQDLSTNPHSNIDTATGSWNGTIACPAGEYFDCNSKDSTYLTCTGCSACVSNGTCKAQYGCGSTQGLDNCGNFCTVPDTSCYYGGTCEDNECVS